MGTVSKRPWTTKHRSPEKTWVYGALRVRDGKELTRCALSRNSKGYIALLQDIEADNPVGDIFIIADNLSSHNSLETRTWLEAHPRLHQVFIPTGACWLNLQEGWWRLFRRDALAGQSFANPKEIEQATRVATAQLNLRAKPWVWGRPARTPRHRRRLLLIAFEEWSTRSGRMRKQEKERSPKRQHERLALSRDPIWVIDASRSRPTSSLRPAGYLGHTSRNAFEPSK